MARRKENDAIFRLKSKHSCPYGMFGKYLAHCRIRLAWPVNRTNILGYFMYFYSRTRSVKRTVNLIGWPAVSRPICFAGVYWFLTAFRLRSGFCNKISLPVVARACKVVFFCFSRFLIVLLGRWLLLVLQTTSLNRRCFKWSPLIRRPRSQPSMRVASTPPSTPVHHLLQQIWFKEASRPHPAEDAGILDCGTFSFGRPICISILASFVVFHN